jgi:diguanylate cyclase (GGDEF)-like protein
MNLNKRVLIVIVPVLLLGYCLATIPVYLSLKNTTKRLEQNRLELAATQLTASFNQYFIFAESYLLTVMESSAFKRLIKEQNDIYHHVALGSSLEEKIKNFKLHQSKKLSLAIIQEKPVEKELYYFELSDDPFAIMTEEQQQYYRKILAEKIPIHWHFINNKNNPTIVVSRIIDRTTHKPPIRSSLDNSVIVQFSIEPTTFISLKENIINDYNAKISIDNKTEVAHNELYSQHKIGKDLTLTINIPKEYLDTKLIAIKLALAIITLTFFIISLLSLYFLINKYITQPISNLENELNDVIANKKTNIDLSTPTEYEDEIGSLKRTFHKIYGDLSRSYLRTKQLSEHDSLTKLHNLNYLNEYIQDALTEAKQRVDKVALIYIDLDNFKFVNDNHGHEIGDALLKAFAFRLTRIVRHVDLISDNRPTETLSGRIAGDEFCVIVTHFKEDDIPEKIAHRILAIFEHGFTFEHGKFPVSASIGIAIYPQDGHTLSQLVSNADNAMYQAKNNGKNNIAFYSKELALSMRRKMDIEHELKTFNPDNELHLVYMPLVNARTDVIDGFEVLVRWTSSKLGFVGPDEFIPIAEAIGQFNKIDRWVIKNAMDSYQALKKRLGYDFKLSINLSSAQLNMNEIADYLFALVDEYQLDPSNIQLEMTETLNVEYTSQANTLLQNLSEKGFKIAIDDFGTGYTALLQLIEYPAHMIKFDKAFVDKAMQDDNRAMLKPIIALCHSQNLEVTIEGVETEEMVTYLKGIGSDYLQGFYYGKPARLEDLKLPSLN